VLFVFFYNTAELNNMVRFESYCGGIGVLCFWVMFNGLTVVSFLIYLDVYSYLMQ